MTDRTENALPEIKYPEEPPARPPMPVKRRPSPPSPSANGEASPPPPPPPPPDPATLGLWGAHDPAVFRDPETGEYFAYCTHKNVYRSADLIKWSDVPGVFGEVPDEAFSWTGSRGMWAPDIIKVGDEYRMYCSNSSFGVRLSCIYLAVSDRPEGPFRYRGIVVKTNSHSPVNAIDANLVCDEATGEQYMVFGSFWGGIRMIRLDPETGLAADKTEADDGRTADSALGISLACRPKWCDGGVEGAYVRFNRETGYYYLFVSYGSLSSDYNIRVGRSRDIKGPYLDRNGRPMTDAEDPYCKTGTMIMCGYRFDGSRGWMAPGHNSVLCDGGKWYLVCHIRPYDVYGRVMSTMSVRRLFFVDGWPVVSPEEYAGEEEQPIPHDKIAGRYEWITLTPTVPQSVIGSAPATLTVSGTMHISSFTRCKWRLSDGNRLYIDMLGGHTVSGVVVPAWDSENSRPTLVFTGIRSDGVAVWAKRTGDMPQRRLPPGGGGPTV